MQRLRIAGRDYLVTEYAVRRLSLRGISIAELREVLADPTWITPSRHARERLRCGRTVLSRRLVVVIEGTPGSGIWDVVTAWVEGHDE